MIRKSIIVVLTLAAVATVVAWVFSYQSRVRLNLGKPSTEMGSRSFGVFVFRGTVWWSSSTWEYRPMTPEEVSFHLRARVDRYGGKTQDKELLPGFGCQTRFRTRDCDVQMSPPSCTQRRGVWLYCPSWFVLTLFAAYPTIAFIRGPLRRWRRSRKGQCIKCGYDLTGNVSGVCPECGAEVKEP